MILSFSCISGKKCGIWKLSEDLNKEIRGELSLNIAMLRSYDVRPTSANVATSLGLIQREFFRYKKKERKKKRKEGNRI